MGYGNSKRRVSVDGVRREGDYRESDFKKVSPELKEIELKPKEYSSKVSGDHPVQYAAIRRAVRRGDLDPEVLDKLHDQFYDLDGKSNELKYITTIYESIADASERLKKPYFNYQKEDSESQVYNINQDLKRALGALGKVRDEEKCKSLLGLIRKKFDEFESIYDSGKSEYGEKRGVKRKLYTKKTKVDIGLTRELLEDAENRRGMQKKKTGGLLQKIFGGTNSLNFWLIGFFILLLGVYFLSSNLTGNVVNSNLNYLNIKVISLIFMIVIGIFYFLLKIKQ